MILRTPVPKKRRPDTALADHESPVSDRRLMIYDDPAPISAVDPPDEMICTYHCRQMVKSEFMIAFNKAEKQVAEYEAKFEKLNNELSQIVDERNKYRDQLLYLEQELEASKGREHALQQQMLKEVEDTMRRYKEQVKRCSELEVKLRKEAESHQKAELSITSANERAMDLEARLQRLSDSSDREKKLLKRELQHLQDDSKFSAHKMATDLELLRLRAENSEKESELLREQSSDLRLQLDECLCKKTELENKLATYAAPSLQRTSSEDENLVKYLQEQLRNYEAEVQEARKLKSYHVKSELLKEKLIEEKRWRERAETELSKLQGVQLHAERLECELASWKSLLEELPDVSSVSDIPQKFAALQKEAIQSMMEVGEIKAHLKQLEVALELAENKRQHSDKEASLAIERAGNAALEVKRLELMLSSVTEERDRIKKELIMLSKQKNTIASGLSNETFMKDLESSLVERENTIKDLKNNLDEQREVVNHMHDELRLLNEQLSTESRRVKSLEREGDRLRSEIALLESKLGHGDYSAANTKVLRMVNTLAVDNEAKHTIEALRDELKKTQAKLQAVEELKGQPDTANIIDGGIPEKLAQLKGQIATLEKREERYKAVFAEKISIFRRACCLLFGYKRSLSNMRTPSYIGEITCTGLYLGTLPPYIHRMRVFTMDFNEVWSIEVDIEYFGSIMLDIETRLEVCELELQKVVMKTSLELDSVGEVNTDFLEGTEDYGNKLKSSSNLATGMDNRNDVDTPGEIVMDDQQRPDGIHVTRFTLQSIYAQSDDEKLEFEYESGNINILVNDYSSQHEVSHQIEIFIRKMNSIPAFTANLTIESFNKRTLG